MNNLKRTIINLDKVLNIQEVKPVKPVYVEPVKLVKVKQDKLVKLSFANYIETVNGRSAMAGRIIAPVTMYFMEHNLNFEVMNNFMELFTRVSILCLIITLVSTTTMKKLDPDSFEYTFELFVGRLFMFDWLYVLILNSF
jgi:hypothetical protein